MSAASGTRQSQYFGITSLGYCCVPTSEQLSNTGQIKYKTSPRLKAPLSLVRRGAGGEVRLLHLITPTYLRTP